MNQKSKKILTIIKKFSLSLILITVIMSPATKLAYGQTANDIPRTDGAQKATEVLSPDNTSITDFLDGIGGSLKGAAVSMIPGANVLKVLSGVFGGIAGNTLGGVATGTLNSVVKVFLKWAQICMAWVSRLFEQIAHMQEFLTEPVNVAWRVIRDFVNMFFAVALLFIAVATASNISALSSYSAKSMLAPLITAAILVNFSKAITLMFIDISQIFFITFYNAATNDGAYSVGDLMGSLAQLDKLPVTSWTTGDGANALLSNILTLVAVSLLLSIFLWSTFILLYRLLAFWVLIAVSPFAFVGSVIKPLRGVWNEWSKNMYEVCTSVPILMFFVYLAAVIVNPASYVQVPYDVASENLTATLQELPTFLNSHAYLAYALALAFLFLANKYAMEGGKAAPGFIKGAIGGALGFATGGAAGYMNMSTWKTHQMIGKGAGAVGSGLKTAEKGFDTVLPDYRRLKRNVADTARRGDLGKGLPVIGGAAAFGAQLATTQGRETLRNYADFQTANAAIRRDPKTATLKDYQIWSQGVQFAQDKELKDKDIPKMLEDLPGIMAEAKKGDARSIALLAAMEKELFAKGDDKDLITFAQAIQKEGYGKDAKGNPLTYVESIRSLNQEILGDQENFAKDLQRSAIKNGMYSFAGISGGEKMIDALNGKGTNKQVSITKKLESIGSDLDTFKMEGERLLASEGKTGSGIARGLTATFGKGQIDLLSDKDVAGNMSDDTREIIAKDLKDEIKTNKDLAKVLKDLDQAKKDSLIITKPDPKDPSKTITVNVTPDKKEAFERDAAKNFWKGYTGADKEDMKILATFANALKVS
jgi:hypothetical protein